jgi:D-alanine-D-alanine ligase-like ATP-grasp enzyme
MAHNVDPPKGVRTAAKAAVEAVGYPWGAVDLLAWRAEGEDKASRVVVLEVNSMPGLGSPMVIEAWVKGFREWAKEEG